MTKQTIEIKGIEKKISTSGKTYWLISTDKGDMSVWTEDILKSLETCSFAEVEVTVKGDFKNIRQFYQAMPVVSSGSVSTNEEAIQRAGEAHQEKEVQNYKPSTEEQVIINKTDKPNSYEVGPTGNRWKLYFNTAKDLLEQIEDLTSKGYEIRDLVRTVVPKNFPKEE